MGLFKNSLFRHLMFIFFTATLFATDQQPQENYKRCQGCHGPSGRATMIGKKLGARDFQDPAVSKMSSSDLANIIADGKNRMPAYKDSLSEQEIKDLAKYVKEMK